VERTLLHFFTYLDNKINNNNNNNNTEEEDQECEVMGVRRLKEEPKEGEADTFMSVRRK
jgi:hypothetical protein